MANRHEYDPQTGLGGRTVLGDELDQAVRSARQRSHRVGLLLIGLEGFKRITGGRGPTVGDSAIRLVAQRLGAGVRETDTICRVGGDEFAVLLPGIVDANHAASVAARIRSRLRCPMVIDGYTLGVAASIGMAISPEDGDGADSLLSCADTAMVRDKAASQEPSAPEGGPEPVRPGSASKDEQLLRHAFEAGELRLHYQPQFDLATGRIQGVEALVRWQSPAYGMIYPEAFMPLAERSGLIVPLGRWILRSACEQAAHWAAEGIMPPRVAVNVSAVELAVGDFVEAVGGIIQHAGMAADRLELELTETALVEDLIDTQLTLRGLVGMGLHVAIDDYGAGHSSLSNLRHFPVDRLKVDGSFLRNRAPGSSNRIILCSILELGKELGHRVIAEGVETDSDLAFLRQQPCQIVQGFHLGKPVPDDEMTRVLTRHRDSGALPA